MTRTLSLIALLLLATLTRSQSASQSANQFGIDQFVLGTDKSVYHDSSLRKIDKWKEIPESKNQYMYQYTPLIKNPLVLQTVSFPSLLLYFDKQYKLASIDFYKSYHSSTVKNPLKHARKDMKKLLAYFEKVWNAKPKKKIYYQNQASTDIGYEWSGEKTEMRLSLNEFKNDVRETAGIGIYITYKGK